VSYAFFVLQDSRTSLDHHRSKQLQRGSRTMNVTQPELPQGARLYMDKVYETLDAIASSQAAAIDAAAQAVVHTIQEDGLVYLFGTGHSHMLAEEGHYRAGGVAAVCPVLSSSLMLHEGAVASTQFERTAEVGPTVLSRYRPTARDSIFIFSNSGVNRVPVETAMTAKEIGMTVIAVVALDYASQVPARVNGKKLADVADIVIDNRGVPGDALVEVGQTGMRVGPGSTVASAFLLNAILTEAMWRLAETGTTPPIYISANIPGAAQHNAQLVEHYRQRNPHL
jgi:uncharacterized phosphosugar-binding protein